MYWNENMGATPPKMIAAVDLNNDQTLNLIGVLHTLTSHPNAGIDWQNLFSLFKYF